MRSILLAGAAFCALMATSPALAQQATAAASAASETPMVAAEETIVVIGQGIVRQGQSVVGSQMAALPPGASPIKLVARLPGVQVSGADAFGTYEWAARINIRGFNQNQLGFTLDGVPLGDMTYGNHNGLHISRALISENLGRVNLSQGSGAINVASSSNLAGALQFQSRDPDAERGAQVNGTVGSQEMYRAFLRFDTGEIEGFGTRMSISGVDASTEKFKGEGPQSLQQWSFKLVQPIQDGEITFYHNNSSRQETDYQDMSLGMIQRLGYGWDNFGSRNWPLAVRVADIAHNRGDTGQPVTNPAAGRTYPAPVATADDAYFDASGLRDDELTYIALDYPIGDTIDLRAQVYRHSNEGQGLWGTPYVISPNATQLTATSNNAPLSIRTTEYDILRRGVLGSITVRLANHRINAGFWTETNDFTQFRRFYGLDRERPQRSFTSFQRNPFFTQWGYDFDTETLQLYIQDTISVSDRLTMNVGIKSLRVENTVRTVTINNAAPVVGADSNLNGTIETDESFLPQIGATFEINSDTELFASYARNTAAFPSVVGSVFGSRSQAVFNETRRTVNPETSETVEGGIRIRGDRFQASAATYFVQFSNRLLAVAQGPGIVGNAAIVSNVGDVETVGLELVGSYNVSDNLTLYGSYSYNSSEYENDVRNRAGALVAATGGKRVVNTAENLFFGEMEYDNDSFFATLSVNYIGDRYFTFTNTGGKVDGRWLGDLTFGYRFSGSPILEGLEVRANISNLGDEKYVGTLGTNGFVNSGDSQTLVTGAPRQYFLTVSKAF